MKDKQPNNASAINHSLSTLIPGLITALERAEVLELAVPGARIPIENDGIHSSIVVTIDPLAPKTSLEKIPPRRKYILIRDSLHLVGDYRTLIRSIFEKIDIGGWLIITVPHQFLSERKFRLPSRHGNPGLRMYTPASLIQEIEEALDPTSYRLRTLQDDDFGYDYDTDINEQPEGNQRIILALEKIRQPRWAGQMQESDHYIKPFKQTDRVVPKSQGPVTTHVISPKDSAINTIIVLKLDHRGDYLMSVPALTELRKQFPGARITFVCGSWNVDSASNSDLFDEVIPYNFFGEDASLHREPKRDVVSQQFRELMKDRNFDLAIDMRFFDDSRSLLRSIKSKFRAGFDRWQDFPWLDISLTLPSPTIDGSAMQAHWDISDFRSESRLRKKGYIELPTLKRFENSRIEIFGPYRELKEGRYQVELQLEASDDSHQVELDIIHSQATQRVFTGNVQVDSEGCNPIKFDLHKPVDDIEIRIYASSRGKGKIKFKGARIVREGAIVGVHQIEAMYLLVQLAALRLRNPYRHEHMVESL